MNEIMKKGSEMILHERAPRNVIKTVLEHALMTRPKEEVYYRPFQKCEHIKYKRTLSSQVVDLNLMYPSAQVGDGVISDFNIVCGRDEDIYLNVSPNVQVFYEKQLIYDGINGTVNTGEKLKKDIGGIEFLHLPVRVKRNASNRVRIYCKKEADEKFSYEFLISVKRYPFMWANDYLFWARNVLPIEELEGEEGVAISKLIKAQTLDQNELADIKVEYQWPPAVSDREEFDFDLLCNRGDICYVYSEVTEDHILSYEGDVEYVLVNHKIASTGCAVKKGDQVLLRCKRNGTHWRVALDTQKLALPFLQSNRKSGIRAIYIGPFWGNQCHAPEYDWDFSKVFRNSKGEQLYWGFADGSELRIYLDSIFWSQWFYASMVGFYGIRKSAIFLGLEEKQKLFCENMSMLAKYFDYIEYDIKKHVMPAFMPRLYELNVLDNIGTMGMNLIDAYLDSNDISLLPIIERIRYQAEETVPRFEDGTYFRVDTMWVDDLYMSCPFLIRMGILTGNNEWLEKAKSQIWGFYDRLYMEDEDLFSHIYFPEEKAANRVPWGRGNGWVMWTLSELLLLGENRVELSKERQLFARMAERLKELQDESGLWHQVLNRKEKASYLETSCTGMFLLALSRGVKNGWLGSEFIETLDKAWQGLLKYSIDNEGNVYGVCMGSGCQKHADYYFDIPTIINDDHGTGVILAAASEYCALLEALDH